MVSVTQAVAVLVAGRVAVEKVGMAAVVADTATVAAGTAVADQRLLPARSVRASHLTQGYP